MKDNVMEIVDIYVQPGTVVYYLDENGYEGDREYARKFMQKYQILTVRDSDIGGFRTELEFEELPGKWFNHAMFGVKNDQSS
jgi:hypothetical protein